MEGARDLALQMQATGVGRVLDQFGNPDNPLAHVTGHRARDLAPDRRHHHPFHRLHGHHRHHHGLFRLVQAAQARNPDYRPAAGGGFQHTRDPPLAGGLPSRHLPAGAGGSRDGYLPRGVGDTPCAGWRGRRASSAESLPGVPWRPPCGSSAEVEGATIVAIICDRGDRYLSTGVFAGD
jgi:cysteine synthase B